MSRIFRDPCGSVCRVNQRKSSGASTGTYVAVVVVVFALVLGLVYWFVIRDDEKDTGTKNPSTTVTAPKTFARDGIPFTFEYPANFAENTGPEGFIWIAGVGPFDMLNVKRIANEPRSVDRLRKDTRDSLSVRPDLKILGEGTDTRDGVTMVRFDVETTVDGKTLRSQLYYFTAAQVTWQFECESEAQRAVIDAACVQALGSFALLGNPS